MSNREVSFICIENAAAAALLCCYYCCCFDSSSAATFAAVRHRAPHGKICCWFIESDPSVSFYSLKDYLSPIFNVPHGSTVAFTASICLNPR